MNPVLTARVGKNNHLIAEVARLYLKPGDIVADVTYGKGSFWQGMDMQIYDFRPTDILTGVDCRNLPYPAGTIDVVVFDPPYMFGSGSPIKLAMDVHYQNNQRGTNGPKAVYGLYATGMAEAIRVLKPEGLLWVKCMDQISSGKQFWDHIVIYQYALLLSLLAEDLFVLVRDNAPVMRHNHQVHARKNHSYLWVFRKKGG